MTWITWIALIAGGVLVASSYANVELMAMYLEQVESYQLVEAILP